MIVFCLFGLLFVYVCCLFFNVVFTLLGLGFLLWCSFIKVFIYGFAWVFDAFLVMC